MLPKAIKPRKALNKAYLKLKCNREDIEIFKSNLTELLNRATEGESEEFHKNLVADFLKNTYYHPNNFINTKGRKDLVIYNGKNSKSTVGVIIEAKKPTNKAEMLSLDNINVKAFHELVLYYLRERITEKNLDLKHIIATNINEWFVFEAHLFEKLFAQNKSLVKQFTDFEEKRLGGKSTDFFYNEIAKPFVEQIKQEIPFTYFDLRDYEKPLKNKDKASDTKLIALFKLFSPEHLLKLPFANDSNTLDKRFYAELLHIIGLTENKKGSKKLIERKPEKERNAGSLIENAIIQLDSLDKISRLKNPGQYGNTHSEKLFAIGLELCITWINRILFLKLLEAQLLKYHKGNKEYAFLNLKKIQNYDDLNTLFFQVLAKKSEDRNTLVKNDFAHVPYLNSSLFEPTDIEHTTLLISNLRDDLKIPILSPSILKDSTGKKRSGELTTLQYLFEFLDAYDFSSEGSEDIQEENKTLINASVLGLIFEKINGYKDGSFFTPGFITMYMCRETIRRAVVQKFNEAAGAELVEVPIVSGVSTGSTPSKNPSFTTLNDIYNAIGEDSRALFSTKQANNIINSLKICDPAVGSGHFLVSALNEIIAIKNDLRILTDRDGKRLKEYHFEVVNDELVITDEDGELFEYHPTHKESQRVQEALFHEKQTIIENCLFGVDINPNSVKICRLRLWIELLKNAYYKTSSPEKGRWPEAGGVTKNLPHPEGGGGCNLNNLPHLKTFRKNLRNNLTPAEATLWTMLKGKALDGRKFRRQHSVANYILDFYCPEERLAIELDGQGHFEHDQAEYDRERDLFLKHVGIKVLRFENRWVWDNAEGLLNAIRDEFGKQPPRQPQADTPPFKGGELDHPGSSSHPTLKGGELRELETLPNIDINIKCGNSLISRFALDADLKQALRKGKWTIDMYRIAVQSYRHATNKEEKNEYVSLISKIKKSFETEIYQNNPEFKKLQKLQYEYNILAAPNIFEDENGVKEPDAVYGSNDNQKKAKERLVFLEKEISKRTKAFEEIKNNKIYDHAFEWRFEFPEVLNDESDFVGFDVVIGNPPYIRQEEFSDLKPYLKNRFEVFHSLADLLTYFVELSHNILKRNGVFQFIISGKFTRAGYGSLMRKFLSKKTELTHFIDFGGKPVFDEATVDAAIVGFIREEANTNAKIIFREVQKEDAVSIDFDKYIKTNAKLYPTNALSEDVWSFDNPKWLSIIEKITTNGTPLSEWDITINFGIKTGYNNAFIIDEAKRNELIEADSKSAEIIKPLLRGRDIQKYVAVDVVNWVIGTFPSKKIDIDEYLGVKSYLQSFGKTIHQTGEKGSRKKTSHRWFETQDNIAFWQDFEKPKLVWKRIGSILRFCYDESGAYCLDSTCIATGSKVKFLAAVLNSKLCNKELFRLSPKTGTGDLIISVQALSPLRVPIPNTDQEYAVCELLEKIIKLKKQNPLADTTGLEKQIDQLVYELYGLSEEEIAIIEDNVK